MCFDEFSNIICANVYLIYLIGMNKSYLISVLCILISLYWNKDMLLVTTIVMNKKSL